MKLTDEQFENIMRNYDKKSPKAPRHLSLDTSALIRSRLAGQEHTKVLPMLIASIITINLLMGIVFAAVLYLMRPLTLADWLIISSIYGTVNALFYGFTYAYRDNVYGFLHDFGGL